MVRRLRGPTGCPWNAKQTPRHLLQALKAEVTELEAAVDSGAIWQIDEELGDVLFNLVALVETYREKQLTDLDLIDQYISRKMRTRHPYVFDRMPDPGPEAAVDLWEKSKLKEAELRRNSQTGTCLGYLLHGVSHESRRDQDWLKERIVMLAGQLGITVEYVAANFHFEKKASGVIVCGDAFDFLLSRVSREHRLLTIHGFTTRKIDPLEILTEIKAIFDPKRIEAGLYPLGSARLESLQTLPSNGEEQDER